MSSTLGDLNTRLSEVLKRSETKNLTSTQRDRALNDALLTDVNHYRSWPPLYKNSTTQAVDGIIKIPYNFRRSDYLALGYNEEDALLKEYTLVDQTRFFEIMRDRTATITDVSGRQVIRVWDNEDQGADISQKTATLDLGLNNIGANTRLFQTFTGVSNIKGASINLKKVGSPEGTITLEIYAVAGGLPTGSALDTKTVNILEFTDSNYFKIFFEFNYDVTVGTVYAIVLSASYATSATDYIAWQYSSTSQYSGGTRGLYDGATYSTAVGDMYFIIWNDRFRFQYEYELTEMTASSDETGLSRDFDEPITMLAAARLLDRQSGGHDQGRTKAAYDLRYGNGGNQGRPMPDSAYGLLNNIWSEIRVRTKRPFGRMRNFFEENKFARRQYYWQDSSPTAP